MQTLRSTSIFGVFVLFFVLFITSQFLVQISSYYQNKLDFIVIHIDPQIPRIFVWISI